MSILLSILVVSLQCLNFELDSTNKSITPDRKTQSVFSVGLGAFQKAKVPDGVDDGNLESLVSVPHTFKQWFSI